MAGGAGTHLAEASGACSLMASAKPVLCEPPRRVYRLQRARVSWVATKAQREADSRPA
jgi:hypothetical protein